MPFQKPCKTQHFFSWGVAGLQDNFCLSCGTSVSSVLGGQPPPVTIDSGAGIYNLGAQIIDSGAGIYDLGAQILDSGAEIYDLGAQIIDAGVGIYDLGT